MNVRPQVCQGDVWKKINGVDVTSCNHSDVTRILRNLPHGTRVQLEFISPKRPPTAAEGPHACCPVVLHLCMYTLTRETLATRTVDAAQRNTF
jgi:hypothetical protein